MNVCFDTFGCRLNRAEALDDEARCLALGHKIVDKHEKADMFVVRCCSVTGRAQHDCKTLIEHLRKKYPTKRLVVTGCYDQAEKGVTFPNPQPTTPNPHPIPTRTARAYLKVQDGCSGNCTFCIVPHFRGKSASEDFTAICDKAARFIDAGYREIVVTGCNLALYANGGRRLPELVSALAELSSDCRIRLGSVEPGPVATELVAAMAEHANLCRYLHIPVQSGSNRVLKAMGRPYTAEDVVALVALARDKMPYIALGCDLMAGFPGETERDLIDTGNQLAHLSFSRAHVFPFSARPGTPAQKLTGQVKHADRSERAHRLTHIASANRIRFAHRFLGKEVDVVIESDKRLCGWTSEYLWFEGPSHLVRGTPSGNRKRLMRFIVRSINGDTLKGVAAGDGR